MLPDAGHSFAATDPIGGHLRDHFSGAQRNLRCERLRA